MPSDLSLVRRLQELDRRIDGLTREIDGLPTHIASIEAKLAAHQKELADTQETLADNGREHRSLEGQVGDFRQKISKLQDQMNSARTNEQFRAFQHEIQFCKDHIDQLEERILDKMEQAEALEENVARAEADLKVESDKVAAEVDRAKARIADDRDERDRQREERHSLSARIDRGALRTYERVRSVRGIAVAAVIGESCGSCHVRLRPKLLQDLRLITKGVLTCESCGMIVYFPDEPDSAVNGEEPVGVTQPGPGTR